MNLRLIFLISLVLTGLFFSGQPAVNATTKLNIVVSAPTLIPLVESAAGEYVEIITVVPFGTDPHEYQLVPRDMEKIFGSDLLIVTGHFEWEDRLASLTKPGSTLNLREALSGKLKLLNLPNGEVNLHEWWLLPYNAKIIINEIASRLAEMDEGSAKIYRGMAEKSARIIDKTVAEVERTLNEVGLVGNVAICSTPIEQYLIEGFGIRCALILAGEELAGIKPAVLENARSILAANSLKMIISSDISEGTVGADAARRLTEETGAYLLRLVVMPSDSWSYEALLTYNAGLISGVVHAPKVSTNTDMLMPILVSILSILVAAEAIIILKLRARRP